MSIRLIIALAAALLLVVFAAQNTVPVGVHLLWWDVSAPAAVAVFAAFAIGVLVGALLFWTDQRRTRKRQQVTVATATTAPAKKRKSWWW
jgi:uncharacterized integral membrane protein